MEEKARLLLGTVDEGRRATLVALLSGAVFVAPAVASYRLAGRTGLISSVGNMSAL